VKKEKKVLLPLEVKEREDASDRIQTNPICTKVLPNITEIAKQ